MGVVNKICTVIIILIVCAQIAYDCYSLHYILNDNKHIKEIIVDTTYNRIVLDSIEYKIVQKDSVIYNYKQQMYEDIKKNNDASNNDVIRTFYQLVAE